MTPNKLLRAAGGFIAAGLITLVGACGNSGTSTTPTAAPTAAATVPPAAPTPANAVVKAGNLEISNGRARTTVTDTTAIYLTIKNTGPADTLLSVSVDPAVAGLAQVHEVVTTGGTMAMQQMQAGLPIPATATVELKSGSYHIMVMNLKKPLNAGDMVPITLVFEKAGSVALRAPAQDDTNVPGVGGSAASPTMAR